MGKIRRTPSDTVKIIFLAAGSDGDIHPHLGLGRELMARGHKVVFLTSFDYVDMARECGFDAVSVMEPTDKEQFEQAGGLSPIAKLKARCQFFSRKVAEICDLAASRVDGRSILVSPPFGYVPAKLLHVRYGVPYVSTVLSPASLCSLRDPPAFKSGEWFSHMPYSARRMLVRGGEQLVIDPVFRSLLKDRIRESGVPNPRRILSEWCYSPQRIIGLFPSWFCPRPCDWPDQLVLTGFPLFDPKEGAEDLPPALCSFLDAGAAPVVFTAGTETHDARAFFEAALKAAQLLGCRAVFLTKLTDQLPPLPATIRHETYAPLHDLLIGASVLVHHGGIGTAAQATRAGIPQLIIPGRLDQFDNGRHLERLGCGLVQKNAFDSQAIANQLQHLLAAPAVHDACRSVQARMEMGKNACGRAADIIEETCRAALAPSFSQASDRSSA